MYGFPTDWSVLLASLPFPAILVAIVALLSLVAFCALLAERRRIAVPLWIAFTILAVIAVPAVERIASGKPRYDSPEYLMARYAPDDGDRKRDLAILAVWEKKEIGIGLLIDDRSDPNPPEWIMLPWDEQTSKRLRQLQGQRENLRQRGIKRGLRLRIGRRDDDRRAGERKRGGQRRLARNWEKRFFMQYEIDWPEQPPPKQEELPDEPLFPRFGPDPKR